MCYEMVNLLSEHFVLEIQKDSVKVVEKSHHLFKGFGARDGDLARVEYVQGNVVIRSAEFVSETREQFTIEAGLDGSVLRQVDHQLIERNG